MQPKCYGDLMVLAVTGKRPAMGVTVANPVRLAELSTVLAQAEAAKQALCALGYGSPDMAIDAIVRLVPGAVKGLDGLSSNTTSSGRGGRSARKHGF